MEMLSNDTYIQKTNKGAQALLVQPPISIKLRYFLHEIPMFEDINDQSLLIKVSQLYTITDSNDPIDFSRTLQDMLLRGWIEPVPLNLINSLLNRQEIKHEEDNASENQTEVETFIAETPIAEKLLQNNDKELSEWLMEEQLKKEALEREEEENKKRKEREKKVNYESESIPEIPWDSPYNSLQDFLNDNKAPKKSFKTDVWENSHNNTLEDSEWGGENNEDDSSSSYSRTQEERYKEQLTLMKKEKRRKTSENSLSDSEKSEGDKNKSKGLFGLVGNLFNKGKK